MNLTNSSLYEPRVWNIIRSFSQKTHPFVQQVQQSLMSKFETEISFSDDYQFDDRIGYIKFRVASDNLNDIVISVRKAFIEYSLEHLGTNKELLLNCVNVDRLEVDLHGDEECHIQIESSIEQIECTSLFLPMYSLNVEPRFLTIPPMEDIHMNMLVYLNEIDMIANAFKWFLIGHNYMTVENNTIYTNKCTDVSPDILIYYAYITLDHYRPDNEFEFSVVKQNPLTISIRDLEDAFLVYKRYNIVFDFRGRNPAV